MFFPDRFICFVNILWSSRRYIIGEVEASWIYYTFLDDNGITFSYPSIWTVINDTNKDNDSIATLMPPSNLDLFEEKMILGRERLQPNMPPHDYSNNAIKVPSMTMDDFQLLDANSFVISGPEWEKVWYTYEKDKRVIQVLQFWSIKDDDVYIISFGTNSNSYLSYLPTISEIISSVGYLQKIQQILPSMIKSMYLFFSLQKGLFLEYPSSWNQESGQNRVSFIANQDEPQDRYLASVDIYHYRNDDNYVSSNIIVEIVP